MSPVEIKSMRTRLGLTQKDIARALGVADLTMSQYETGFRQPGPTALILLVIMDSLSEKKALDLIELCYRASEVLELERKDSNK